MKFRTAFEPQKSYSKLKNILRKFRIYIHSQEGHKNENPDHI
jgi:hypothetical protein